MQNKNYVSFKTTTKGRQKQATAQTQTHTGKGWCAQKQATTQTQTHTGKGSCAQKQATAQMQTHRQRLMHIQINFIIIF